MVDGPVGKNNIMNSERLQNIAEEKLPPKAWLTVILLFFVGLLNYLDRNTITTMHTSITEAIPMSDKQFSLLTAVFLWTYGIFSPFAGYLADRFGRSKIIIVSLFIWSVVTWLTAHATTFNQLLSTRALMGLSEACYIPAALALICDYHKGPTQSTATGIHMAGVFIGASLGFIGGWIAQEHTWNLAFTIFGSVGIAYAILIAFILRDAPRQKISELQSIVQTQKFSKTLRTLFSNRSFYYMLIFWSLLSIVAWLITAWLPTFYIQHFGFSQKIAGIYATAYLYPASVAGLILGGIIADKWRKKNPRARMLVPAIGLCIAAPMVFFASETSLVVIAIIFFGTYAFTKAFSDTNMMPILSTIATKDNRATGYGVLNLFSCIVGGVGIYAGGYLRDANISFTNIFRIASLLIPVCIVLLLLIKSRKTNSL
ncbi:MAG TPA: MFS transporter [Flavisolibacter sp.]|jgi:MFS family permease|nr:MFS transporter [Flavisolibacter sp.]